MARVSPNSPRFRTKQQLAEDVAKVLNSELHYGTKYAVLKEVTWVWTEYLGKFNGCIYWSEAALRRFNRERSVKSLRHEHVVPKKCIIEMLFELKSPAANEVQSLLDHFLIGVIVTKEEDDRLSIKYSKSMPPSFLDESSSSYRDVWLRYRECGIDVCIMSQQRMAVLEHLSKVASAKQLTEPALRKLEKALYRHGWIDSDFDWPNWKEANEYINLPDKITTADIFVLRKLLTTHFRKERYCEGHLETIFSCGHFKALYRRLKQLRRCRAFE